MVEDTKDEITHSLKVLSITDQEDGSAIVEFEVGDKFRSWFKEREGLKRWSQKRFQKFVIDGLRLFLDEEDKKQGLMAELADATDLKSVEG